MSLAHLSAELDGAQEQLIVTRVRLVPSPINFGPKFQ
jgi:hypothetical protein